MASLELEHVSGIHLSPQAVEEICTLKVQYWPYPMRSQRAWFDKYARADDLHVLARRDGRVVAYLRLVSRVAETDRRMVSVKGMSTVCVTRHLIGQGVGRELVTHANRLIDVQHREMGLLQCTVALAAFYARLGWRVLEVPVYIRGASRKLEPFLRDELAMAYSRDAVPDKRIVVLGDRF